MHLKVRENSFHFLGLDSYLKLDRVLKVSEFDVRGSLNTCISVLHVIIVMTM